MSEMPIALDHLRSNEHELMRRIDDESCVLNAARANVERLTARLSDVRREIVLLDGGVGRGDVEDAVRGPGISAEAAHLGEKFSGMRGGVA